MDPTDRRLERSRDLERFLTFVDAVVAIAITLLVLPLVDVAGEVGGHGSVGRLLVDHGPQLLGFGLSFVVIASLWFTQHRVMRTVIAEDPVVIRLTVLWMLTIVFLPFPTALVAVAGNQATTKLLYIGTMTVSAVTVALMSGRIRSVPSMRDSDEAPDPMPAWVTAGLFLVALAISLAFPVTGYAPLLLLLLTDVLARAVHRLRPGRSGTTRVGE